ncbi:choice-of-anchor A family protein, partial [Paenibacillus odorifer]
GLGIAGDYNAFIFGKATVTASLRGNLAAGGDTTTSSVDINMSNGNKVPYAIVTGGNLDFTNGTVYGNIIHQGEFNKVDSGSIISGTYRKVTDTLIDFASAQQYYVNLSNQLATVPQNGTTELKYNGLYIKGDHSVNIFNLTADYFNQAGWTNVTASSGSTMIYTITGSTVNVHKAFDLPQNTTGNNILYNFPDATAVNISGVEIKGSILAPKAALNISNGNVYGNVIAASLSTASCYIAILPYTGPVPVPTPTPTPSPSSNPLVRTIIKFSEMTITA